MCSSEELKKRIDDIRQTNIIEHGEIKEYIKEVNNNSISAISDLKEFFKERFKAIKEDKENTDKVTKKESDINKWIIRISISLIIFFSGTSSYYLRETYKAKAATEINNAKLLETVQNIEEEYYSQSDSVKCLDDSLTKILKNIHTFYNTEWAEHINKSKKNKDSVKTNRIILLDHEKRIAKLENKK